ncbi:CalY family protein [Terrisporobacter hibernicus]|uniref:M73 family metallopeptidase n=1 Tax=Terrisporobacter hibernicus TaxID=2813371 RepID=A0AAX2ZHC3_9FIRM|nr:CalY family protein [Terrisporobacter hibernicus]UEL48714.1 M73 family metallopeptidase [Terrisporobacter hibernicus]
MSRLNRMKMKKQQCLKATICGVSLCLLISVTGVLGSYAYLSDKETVDNNIVITLGNVNTSIDKGINFGELRAGKEKTRTFYIENSGSLNQKVSMKFMQTSSQDEYDKLLSKTLNFRMKIIEVDEYDKVVESSIPITQQNLDKYYDGSVSPKLSSIVLESGHKYKIEATIMTNKYESNETRTMDAPLYPDETFSFGIQVNAEQVKGEN